MAIFCEIMNDFLQEIDKNTQKWSCSTEEGKLGSFCTLECQNDMILESEVQSLKMNATLSDF